MRVLYLCVPEFQLHSQRSSVTLLDLNACFDQRARCTTHADIECFPARTIHCTQLAPRHVFCISACMPECQLHLQWSCVSLLMRASTTVHACTMHPYTLSVFSGTYHSLHSANSQTCVLYLCVPECQLHSCVSLLIVCFECSVHQACRHIECVFQHTPFITLSLLPDACFIYLCMRA